MIRLTGCAVALLALGWSPPALPRLPSRTAGSTRPSTSSGKAADELVRLIERAGKAGYTGVSSPTTKLNILDRVRSTTSCI